MKITKFDHALLSIESGSKLVVIDPGTYSKELPDFKDVVAICITHIHEDHSYLPHIQKILSDNPDAQIFGPAEVAKKLAGLPVQVVYHGDHYEVGGFELDFSGDLHEEIHRSIPLIQNTGVTVNRTLYYPGDSYTIPEDKVKVLACPASAPWLKISDVMDFISAVKPETLFPTHNALLSGNGHELYNQRISEVTQENGGNFVFLEPGQSLETSLET
jgi:L-ascorbate metabolism protein UlaG (beta-lactamase superfamily)